MWLNADNIYFLHTYHVQSRYLGRQTEVDNISRRILTAIYIHPLYYLIDASKVDLKILFYLYLGKLIHMFLDTKMQDPLIRATSNGHRPDVVQRYQSGV